MKPSRKSQDTAETARRRLAIGVAVLAVLTGLLGWGVVGLGQHRSSVFWLSGLLAVANAIITFRIPDRYSLLGALWIIASLVAPTMVAVAVPALKGMSLFGFVYLLACLWIALYQMYRGWVGRAAATTAVGAAESEAGKVAAELKRVQEEVPFPVVVAGYVPPGYGQPNVSTYRVFRRGGYRVVTLPYGEEDSDRSLLIRESTGRIAPERVDYEVTTQREVKGTMVTVRYDAMRDDNAIATADPVPLIDATWSSSGVNFNLRANELPWPEVEKIIASML